MEVDDIDGTDAVQRFATEALGAALADPLSRSFERLAALGEAESQSLDAAAIGRRALKNACLGLLARSDPGWAGEAAMRQFERGANMTDVLAALAVLAELDVPQRQEALDRFHVRWRDEPLVLDKWFAIQAGARRPTVLADVQALSAHPDFDLGNPNRVRALIGPFASGRIGLHDPSGAGYRLLADIVLAIDPRNSQIAARSTTLLARWPRLDEARRALVQAELRRILDTPGLSRGTFEMVTRSLGPSATSPATH
jgi:aminopeptidase N